MFCKKGSLKTNLQDLQNTHVLKMLDFNIFNVFEKGVTSFEPKYLQNTHVLKKKGHFDRGGLKYAQCFVKKGSLKTNLQDLLMF